MLICQLLQAQHKIKEKNCDCDCGKMTDCPLLKGRLVDLSSVRLKVVFVLCCIVLCFVDQLYTLYCVMIYTFLISLLM